MKKTALALILALTSVSAFAEEYTCKSTDHSFSTHLIFDDGPGGLDMSYTTVNGQKYQDISDSADVIAYTDRDTNRGTYEYASDKLEIGFTAKDGLKIDLFATNADQAHFKGKVLVTKGSKKKTLALVCTYDSLLPDDDSNVDSSAQADSSSN